MLPSLRTNKVIAALAPVAVLTNVYALTAWPFASTVSGAALGASGAASTGASATIASGTDASCWFEGSFPQAANAANAKSRRMTKMYTLAEDVGAENIDRTQSLLDELERRDVAITVPLHREVTLEVTRQEPRVVRTAVDEDEAAG